MSWLRPARGDLDFLGKRTRADAPSPPASRPSALIVRQVFDKGPEVGCLDPTSTADPHGRQPSVGHELVDACPTDRQKIRCFCRRVEVALRRAGAVFVLSVCVHAPKVHAS